MKISFHKYHALGNDYLVIDPSRQTDPHFHLDFLNPQNIRKICHRNFGIGSDGILLGPLQEKDKPLRLRIFNPDGGEAEKSGNGIRIFSRYLKDFHAIDRKFLLQTWGGLVEVEFLEGAEELIRVDMGGVTFYSKEIPVAGPDREVVKEELKVAGRNLSVTCLSVGNPHCVVPLDEISEKLARDLGPSIENHPLFPNRINLQLLKVLDRKNIQIEIWERGAGYTLASGSSSCAAACAAQKLGLIDSSVTVHMPGGKILIDRSPNGHVLMTGPVTRVASGELNPQLFEISPTLLK